MTETNIIEVMGTNILTIWPHGNMVTNLNADMLDGYHASELRGGITNEVDPQVDDAQTPNYVPRWDSVKLVTGNIYNDPAGNVGIGTTEPGAKLDVNGIIRTSYSTPTIQLLDSSVQMTRVGNGLSVFAYNDIKFGTLVTGAGGAMTILQSGNVGIGTAGPVGRLHVVGDPGLMVQGDQSAIQHRKADGTVKALTGLRSDVAGADHFTFYGYGGLNWIFQNGNVGIGTTAPGTALDVNGIIRTSYSTPTLQFLDSSAQITRVSSPANRLRLHGYGGIDFGTQETGQGGAMTILQSGNVGIGTPSPAAKLDVNGSAIIRGPLGLALSDFRIQTTPDVHGQPQVLALRATDDYTVLMPGCAGFRVTNDKKVPPEGRNNLILANAADQNGFQLFLLYGKLLEGSDSRLKLNQEPLDYGLAEVLKLEPKRYVRTDSVAEAKTGEQESQEGESGSEIGLIAQDVYEVVPEAVGRVVDGGREIWLLSYSSLVPVLIKAVQEQQKQIEEQKEINEAQEAKITSLEKRITALEQK